MISIAFSIALTAPPRRQSGCPTPAWPGRPGTVIVGMRLPRQDVQTSNPDGSVTMPASARTPWATAASPPAPVDSSSVTVQTSKSPASRTPSAASTSAANVIAAMPPFMSHEPRP
jgi:hypothetical protein